MALTEAQRADIRLYLGFDRGYDLHPALESRFAAGRLTLEEEARIASALSALAQIDAKILSAALNNLDLAKAEDVTFLGPEQLAALRTQGRMLIQRIGILFAIEPSRDYFDGGGAHGMGGLFAMG